MWQDVISVEPKDGYRLFLRFEDGAAGIIDVAVLVEFSGVFAPLRDRAYFEQVRVEPDLGTIVWPNGADLDPVVIYARATGQPVPDFSPVVSD